MGEESFLVSALAREQVMVAQIVWVTKIPVESLSCFWPDKSEDGAEPGERGFTQRRSDLESVFELCPGL